MAVVAGAVVVVVVGAAVVGAVVVVVSAGAGVEVSKTSLVLEQADAVTTSAMNKDVRLSIGRQSRRSPERH